MLSLVVVVPYPKMNLMNLMIEFCELVGIEVDAGLSAKTLDRPGLQSALSKLDAGEAQALIVLKLDRLTRRVADLDTLIERYFGSRFTLMSVSEQIDTSSAAGRLVLNVLTSVAQWERETTSETKILF